MQTLTARHISPSARILSEVTSEEMRARMDRAYEYLVSCGADLYEHHLCIGYAGKITKDFISRLKPKKKSIIDEIVEEIRIKSNAWLFD